MTVHVCMYLCIYASMYVCMYTVCTRMCLYICSEEVLVLFALQSSCGISPNIESCQLLLPAVIVSIIVIVSSTNEQADWYRPHTAYKFSKAACMFVGQRLKSC